jgi:hypothetical protein
MDFAWLVERKIYNTQVEYGCIHNGHHSWTANSYAALRYARKEDADNVIDGLDLQGAYPAEHGWDNALCSNSCKDTPTNR